MTLTETSSSPSSASSTSTRWRAADVPTPALLIDPDVAGRNIARMQQYAEAHGLALRPHTKTHKSIVIAARQLAAGARGLTVAKVGEAEVMAAGVEGLADLLVAYPVFDAARRDRVVRLVRDGSGNADRGRTIRIGVDSTFAVDALAEAARAAGVTVGFLVELDAGFHRTGVQTPAEALRLARHVDRTAARGGARLDGMMFYAGHIKGPHEEQAEALKPVSAIVAETLALWRASGLEARIVSGGSTPSAARSHLVAGMNEIRPGTYVYQDMNGVLGGYCTLDDCAARFVCTVISTAVPGKVVLDAGSKTFTSDRNKLFADAGFGHIVEYPQAKIVRLSEEHGEVDLSACDRTPKLGERVHVIPTHICPCVNLQDRAWLCRGLVSGERDAELEPLVIDARGKSS